MIYTTFQADFGLLLIWGFIFLLMISRYLLFAGGAYWVCYVWKKDKLLARRIQKQAPKPQSIRLEIYHSLQTALIFACLGLILRLLRVNGYSQVYFDLESYGYGYSAFSFLLLIFLHDAYFYWVHRGMHYFSWGIRWHQIHHRSHNPSPWAAFSFHPAEALLEFAFAPLIVLVLPLHPLVLFSFATWALTWNIIGHLGYELFPAGFVHHPFFRWFNTSTHHNLHHQKARYNYGLYFNFWDTWMKTNDPNYLSQFDLHARDRQATSHSEMVESS